MIKNNVSIFDFDGTISKNGEISKNNKAFLEGIKRKVINTSRSFEELPAYIHNNFKYIMTLNGSLFYIDGDLNCEFKQIQKHKVEELIDFAKTNNYNIAFNNTKTKFFNVKNKSSQKFMKENGIRFSNKIICPDKVFQIAISSPTEVDDFKGSSRQSKRFIEFSLNDKSNISIFFDNYIAYGDSENDFPMFKKALKYFLVENADLTKISR